MIGALEAIDFTISSDKMESFILALFQIIPMVIYQVLYTSVNFSLHKKLMQNLGIQDDRIHLMVGEIMFALQEIYLLYPDSEIILGLCLSFITLRYVRFKWVVINILVCLSMTPAMGMIMARRMTFVTSAWMFFYMHLEFVRLFIIPPIPEEEIPLEALM